MQLLAKRRRLHHLRLWTGSLRRHLQRGPPPPSPSSAAVRPLARPGGSAHRVGMPPSGPQPICGFFHCGPLLMAVRTMVPTPRRFLQGGASSCLLHRANTPAHCPTSAPSRLPRCCSAAVLSPWRAAAGPHLHLQDLRQQSHKCRFPSPAARFSDTSVLLLPLSGPLSLDARQRHLPGHSMEQRPLRRPRPHHAVHGCSLAPSGGPSWASKAISRNRRCMKCALVSQPCVSGWGSHCRTR